MLGMIDHGRMGALLLALVSQVLGGLVVLCDEGTDGLVLEVLPQHCCGDPVADAEGGAVPESDPDSCGCCQDAPVAVMLQRQGDGTRWEPPQLAPHDAAPLPGGEPPRAIAGRAWPGRVPARPTASLVGTIVLVC